MTEIKINIRIDITHGANTVLRTCQTDSKSHMV